MEHEVNVINAPNQYINTGKATLLAIIKLIEALAGCYLIYCIVSSAHAVDQIVNQFYDGLYINTNGAGAFGSVSDVLTDSIRYILMGELLLIVLDGFGAFFTRIVHKGAGLVQICHRIRFIFNIIGFFVALIAIFMYGKAIYETSRAMNSMGYGDIFSLFGSYQLLLYVLVFLGAFWVLTMYDHHVARVMKQVSRELKDGKIERMHKKSHLGRESAWLCFLLIASVVLSVIDLVRGNELLSELTSSATSIQLIYGGFTLIRIVATVALLIKFLLVNRCSADFDRAH